MGLFEELKNKYDYIWVELSDYNEKKLEEKIREFRNKIIEENKTISDINEQIIITCPYPYHKIVGCLHHYAVEISGHKVKDAKGKLALFTGWDVNVLSKEV